MDKHIWPGLCGFMTLLAGVAVVDLALVALHGHW
jgi:hypothetical protein